MSHLYANRTSWLKLCLLFQKILWCAADIWWNRRTDTIFCNHLIRSPVSKVYIIFCAIFCCDTVLPTGKTFTFLSLHTGVFSLKMVMMRSQVQHLPPLHHAQCPLQATLHLPVQQPLIYFCRGFRSSAQIGTFIHTWPMDHITKHCLCL